MKTYIRHKYTRNIPFMIYFICLLGCNTKQPKDIQTKITHYKQKADSLYELGNRENALLFHDSIILLMPTENAFADRARVLESGGNALYMPRAIEDYTRAINISRSPMYFYNRSGCYAILQDTINAFRDIDTLLMLEKDTSIYNYYDPLSFVYFITNQNNRAINLYNYLIERRPDIFVYWANRGICYLRIGDTLRGCEDILMAKKYGLPPDLSIDTLNCEEKSF